MSGLVVDLFAGGPSGWCVGARELGLDPLGFEWDADCCATRAAMGLRTVRADVAQLDTPPLSGRLSGLCASPPCQAFSAAGKGLGKRDLPLVHAAVDGLIRGVDLRAELAARCEDPRSLLVVEPLRVVLASRPEWTVWEQVPPVLPLWQDCAGALRAAGYSTWAGVLNAADYGVPQTRERAILLASRTRTAAPPPPTHAKDGGGDDLFGPARLPWVSMAQALGMDGVNRPARTVCGDRTLRWACGAGATSYNTGWRLDVPGGLSHADWLVLQGFPADLPVRGGSSSSSEQISNAIPPPLAMHVIAAASGLPATLRTVAA